MQTVYLKDGRVADLVTKTEKGYLVDPHKTFRYYEDNEETAPSGDVELVQEIFETPPKDLIESECQKIYDRMEIISTERDKLQKERNDLAREIDSLKRQKTDLSKLIFNKSEIKNAKRLIVFAKDRIAPIIYDPVNRSKLSLSVEISDYDPKIRAWAYKFYGDGTYNSGDYFDEKYGVKCDLTDEEIADLNIERINNNKFSDWVIKSTEDKWLTVELIERKKQILEKEKINTRSEKEKELAKIQEWLANN